MGRRPARVKASTRVSVKPLDAANGMMDRLTDNVDNIELFCGKFFSSFLPSAGQQWETERVDLVVKRTHPPPPLQLGQQVRKGKSYIQASFRVCRNPKRNTLFSLLTTGFTLHRKSSTGWFF